MGIDLKKLCFSVIIFISLALAEGEDQFIYTGFQEAQLNLAGNATVHPNGLLQLTNTAERQKGYAFYPSAIIFNLSSSQSLSFSTYFVFAMVPGLQNFSGQGLSFFVSPTMDFNEATASSYLGLFNISNIGLASNHIFAVEFDTVVSPAFNDLNGEHVGIDVNGLISTDSAFVTYFDDKEDKNISLRLVSGNLTQVWIQYDGVQKLLNVTVAPISVPKPTRPLLSTFIDLSQIFLESMYIGLAAATGTLANDHYILGWSFNRSGEAEILDVSKLPSLPPSALFPKQSKKGGQKPISIIIVSAVAFIAVLITVGCAIYIVRKKEFEEVYEDWEEEYGPHRFSYKTLNNATRGWKEKEVIGKGGFGKVYRGFLSSSDQIAVKRVSHESGEQALKQFVAEIASLGRLRHRNLVQLRGYCRRKRELLLVYEYLSKGSLDNVLYSSERQSLNWFQRIRILKNVASGLLYLHEGWEKIIIHRDIKPANILLDEDLNGKLGDFGLARQHYHDNVPQTTNLVGTVGYLAPELLRTGKATTSTDVFAFGMCTLEMACGRRPKESGKPDLAEWVIECWDKGAIFNACDPGLEGLYVEDQMELVLKLGLFCSHPNPETRPSMRQVVQLLDGDAKFPDSADSSLLDAFKASYNEASTNAMAFPTLFSSSSSSHTVSSTLDSILIYGR